MRRELTCATRTGVSNPADRLLVERPTYVGALQDWNAYQAQYITIALDDMGLPTDEIEAARRTTRSATGHMNMGLRPIRPRVAMRIKCTFSTTANRTIL